MGRFFDPINNLAIFVVGELRTTPLEDSSCVPRLQDRTDCVAMLNIEKLGKLSLGDSLRRLTIIVEEVPRKQDMVAEGEDGLEVGVLREPPKSRSENS